MNARAVPPEKMKSMLENTQTSIQSVELDNPSEQQFRVKLYHPLDDSIRCKMSGRSEFITIFASTMPQVRTRVESDMHEIFRGDSCKSCGALAKVSVTNITPAPAST